ncbi:hypothetical protein [Butyrivibrio sp.]|uniref:hypothetical protein n=1 Tax=Butyrivibrio sp. TaxID=28121 RepID=UPI0025BFD4B1|nr:hypothetical protein [Butyrivibrio sp.]MBQ9303905.1 hypothetical protein [Butyrivibrio sp.]MBQ9304151.1 hypothetical protein [Butyrivibrio sp.]
MRLGSSNKFFYYAMSNAKSFNLRYILSFREALEISAIKKAVRKALDVYKEFSCRIVVQDNCFSCEYSSEMPFFHEADDIWDTETFDFASDELKGFPFYFQYTSDKLLISYFHGLTDIVGMNTFIKSVLYFYSIEIGQIDDDEKKELADIVFCSDEQLEAIEDGIRYDPYGTCGNTAVEPDHIHEDVGAYYLEDNKKDHMHYEEIEINTDDFSKLVEQYKSSFVGLIMVLTQQALRKSYETGDENVTVMLPVNQRPYFGTSGIQTNVNCSDSIMVDYTADKSQESLMEQCAYTRGCFDKAIRSNNFIKMAGDKNQLVTDFESSGRSPVDIAAEVQAAYDESGFNGLSYVITSPGRFILPPALDRLIEDIDINSYAAAHSFWVYTFRKSFRIKYCSRNDSLKLMDALKDELGHLNVNYQERCRGILKGDRLYLKDLKEGGSDEYRRK